MTDFKNADFYECGTDAENTSVSAAVEEYLDAWAEPNFSPNSLIRKHSPIIVRAFKKMEIDERFYADTTEILLERASEKYSKEYGHPYLDDNLNFESARPLILKALKNLYISGKPCKQVGTVELSAEEVKAIMLKQRPDWWANNDEEP